MDGNYNALISNGATLSNYDPPWYDKLTGAVTDFVYGDDANARQYEGVNKLLGPSNPFNAPAQVTRGVGNAVDGYQAGNYGQATSGALEAALALSPLLAARGLMPSVRNANMARAKHAMHPNEASALESSRNMIPPDDFAVFHNAGAQNRLMSPAPIPTNDQAAMYARISGRVRRLPGGIKPSDVR